jgi:hypothetical protein
MSERARIAEPVPGRVVRAGGRWPRGLRRDDAAGYLGISTTKFDDWVGRGLMPRPKRQDGVVVSA